MNIPGVFMSPSLSKGRCICGPGGSPPYDAPLCDAHWRRKNLSNPRSAAAGEATERQSLLSSSRLSLFLSPLPSLCPSLLPSRSPLSSLTLSCASHSSSSPSFSPVFCVVPFSLLDFLIHEGFRFAPLSAVSGCRGECRRGNWSSRSIGQTSGIAVTSSNHCWFAAAWAELETHSGSLLLFFRRLDLGNKKLDSVKTLQHEEMKKKWGVWSF